MVRINLDYYRILSVPIKASPSQLERAYEDRVHQQPRRDYSKLAISLRKKLLTRAFKVLRDPEKRAAYDSKFIAPNVAQNSNFKNLELQAQAKENPKKSSEPKISSPQEPLSTSAETNFLAKPSETTTSHEQFPTFAEPYLEIEPQLVVGALLILHELAEYEMVAEIGNDYLNQEAEAGLSTAKQSKNNENTLVSNLDKTKFHKETTNNLLGKTNNQSKSKIVLKQQEVRTDIIFCVALSCLEISREKWRRQEWEEAAAYGDQGLKILKQENQSLFSHLQAEIQSELNLLKPYRILHLLEHNAIGSDLRRRGLKLLQEVLAQRNGNSSKGVDPSGLKSDQFLYFIQQIRNYLTLQEQKELFLVESKRGSHPGSCIAAYALIAEGFARKKPSSIMQANDILISLGQHQNTHWERAICALLLGQANESQEVIEQIRQDSTYALIKKRSHNSPDLLPGLCFYGEQWLNKEVLSQFQDLKSSKITLSEYFNDSNVQAYIETVAPISYRRNQSQDFDITSRNDNAQVNKAHEFSSSTNVSQPYQNTSIKTKGILGFLPWFKSRIKIDRKANEQFLHQQKGAPQIKAKADQPLTYKDPLVRHEYHPEKVFTEQTVAYSKAHQNFSRQTPSGIYKPSSASASRSSNSNLTESQSTFYNNPSRSSLPSERKGMSTAIKYRSFDGNGGGNRSVSINSNKHRDIKRRGKTNFSFSSNFLKSSLFMLALVVGLGTLSFMFTRKQIINRANTNRKIVAKEFKREIKTTSGAKPQLRLDQPQVNSLTSTEVPRKENTISTTTDQTNSDSLVAKDLNQKTAKEVIQKWLDSKKAALGKNYDSNQLSNVLTAQMLTQWQQRSIHYKQNKIYRQLSHTIKVSSLKLDPNKPNIATVEAEVTEIAKHYQGDKLNQSKSYNDNLLVRYDLIKQNGSWLIKGSEVVKNL